MCTCCVVNWPIAMFCAVVNPALKMPWKTTIYRKNCIVSSKWHLIIYISNSFLDGNRRSHLTWVVALAPHLASVDVEFEPKSASNGVAVGRSTLRSGYWRKEETKNVAVMLCPSYFFVNGQRILRSLSRS